MEVQGDILYEGNKIEPKILSSSESARYEKNRIKNKIKLN